MLGGLLSGVGNILGSVVGAVSNSRNNDKNANLQREFAQNSISWRVQDAKNAGIHPLYALGASTVSAQPSFISADTSGIGRGLSDIGGAISGYKDSKYNDTLKKQTLEKNALELEQLKLQNAQIQKTTSLMGQSPLNSGRSEVPLKSSLPIAGQGDSDVLGQGRYVVNKSETPGIYYYDPTNDMVDRMSEGIVDPLRERAKIFSRSYVQNVANTNTLKLKRAGKLPSDRFLVPRIRQIGNVAEFVLEEVPRKQYYDEGWHIHGKDMPETWIDFKKYPKNLFGRGYDLY